MATKTKLTKEQIEAQEFYKRHRLVTGSELDQIVESIKIHLELKGSYKFSVRKHILDGSIHVTIWKEIGEQK